MNQGVRKRRNEVEITGEKGREGNSQRAARWKRGKNDEVSEQKGKAGSSTTPHYDFYMIQELTQILFQEFFGEL